MALDKQTGKVRWKTSRRSPCEPGVLDAARDSRRRSRPGRQRRARIARPRTIRCTGEEIWRVELSRTGSRTCRVRCTATGWSSSPPASTSRRCWRCARTARATSPRRTWRGRCERGAPLTPSPLLVGDELYIVNDIGIASCLDAKTGTTIWQQRLRRQLLGVAGLRRRPHLLPERGRRGDGHRAGHGRSGKLATNALDGATLASMAVSDRSIFIRTGTHLYRIGTSARPPGAQPAAPERLSTERPDHLRSRRRGFPERPHRRIGDRIRRRWPGWRPRSAPQLWQRGIALYYAGRYQDCREQFEAHRRVNPDDVENAAWHFLCVARAESVAEAQGRAAAGRSRSACADASRSTRCCATRSRPESVLTAAGDRPEAVFYAHLYLGLYFEALGNKARALEHITAAAADRYAPVGGYMHAVAKVHLGILQRAQVAWNPWNPDVLRRVAVVAACRRLHGRRRSGRRSSDADGAAPDWPQFLGPARNGVYSGPPLAETWPAAGPPKVWQKSVGEGFAGPVVVGDRVILFHRVEDEEVVEALDARTGKTRWRYAYQTAYRDDFGFDEGPRAVPVVANGRVYTFGAEGQLHAVDAGNRQGHLERGHDAAVRRAQGILRRRGLAAGRRRPRHRQHRREGWREGRGHRRVQRGDGRRALDGDRSRGELFVAGRRHVRREAPRRVLHARTASWASTPRRAPSCFSGRGDRGRPRPSTPRRRSSSAT